MTIEQIVTDITAALGALGILCSILAHLPIFPAKWAERFARFATYAANAKFSVNVRDALPKKAEPRNDDNTPPWGGQTGALVMLLAIGFALQAQGCSGSQSKVCNPADAGKLTADYAAKVHVLCQGYTFDSCPMRPSLEADLSKQLEAACPTH